MSDIYGNGYGSKHDWVRGHTNQSYLGQVYSYKDKATMYTCKNCGQTFSHQYGVISDIFEAIKQSGVTEECINPHTIGEKGEV